VLDGEAVILGVDGISDFNALQPDGSPRHACLTWCEITNCWRFMISRKEWRSVARSL